MTVQAQARIDRTVIAIINTCQSSTTMFRLSSWTAPILTQLVSAEHKVWTSVFGQL